jgi:hypothetical protein
MVIKEINPITLKQWMIEGRVNLVDIRETTKRVVQPFMAPTIFPYPPSNQLTYPSMTARLSSTTASLENVRPWQDRIYRSQTGCKLRLPSTRWHHGMEEYGERG